MNISITVVIPTLNRRESLLMAIHSVYAQAHKVFEIIVIDDGSSDDTQEAISRNNFSNVRFVRNEKNLGVAYSRNLGVALAKTEWVAFLDSDDVYFRNHFSAQVNFLHKFPNFDAVCGRVAVSSGGSPNNSNTHPPCSVDLSKGLSVEQTLSGAIVAPSTWLIKTTVFQKLGGFDVSLKKSEDRDFLIRFLKNHSIGGPNEVIGTNFRRADSLTNIVDPTSSYILLKKHEQIFLRSLTRSRVASMYSNCGIEFLRIGDVGSATKCYQAESRLINGFRSYLKKGYMESLLKLIQANSIPLRLYRKFSRSRIGLTTSGRISDRKTDTENS